MKAFSFVIVLFLAFISHNKVQGQAAQQSFLINQTIVPNQSINILIDLPEKSCNVIRTKSKRILIEQNVLANVNNSKIIDVLTKKGRYHLEAIEDKSFNSLTIRPQNTKGIIFIKGVQLSDPSQYTIYLPENMHYRFANSNATDLASTN